MIRASEPHAPADPASNKARVLSLFVSYSRRDGERVQQLVQTLAQHFDVSIDLRDIDKGEPWKPRLGQLIASSDAIVFMISPASVKSDVCDWEINEGERAGKRIFPVVVKATSVEDIPARLQRLNFTFADTPEREAAEFPLLLDAIRVDTAWVREQSRLYLLARRWRELGQPRHLLLRSRDIETAEHWQAVRPAFAPAPPQVCADYIVESRRGAGRRQRGIVIALSTVLVVVGTLAVLAYWQMRVAIDRQHLAESNELSLRSDQLRASNPLEALKAAIGAYDAKPTDGALDAVRRSIDGVALERAWVGTSRWAASADGTRIAALDSARNVILFDGNRLERTRTVALPSEFLRAGPNDATAIREIALSAQGRFLAITDESGKAAVMDLTSPSPQAQSLELPHPAKAVRFGHTESMLAAIGPAAISIFTLPSPTPRATIDPHLPDLGELDFNADDTRLIVAGHPNRAAVMDARAGGRVIPIDMTRQAAILQPSLGGSDADMLSHVRFMPDGASALTSGSHALWSRWNTTTGVLIQSARTAMTGAGMDWAEPLPDGSWMVAEASNSGSVAWWNLDDASHFQPQDGTQHRDLIDAHALSRDGAVLATVSRDQTLRYWSNRRRGWLASIVTSRADITNLAFSADDLHVVTRSASGEIALWDTSPVDYAGTIAPPQGSLYTARFCGTGERLVTFSGGDTVRVWDIGRMTELPALRTHARNALSAAISADCTHVATVGDDHALRIWDASSGTLLHQYAGDFDAVTFDRSGTLVGANSFAGAVRIVRFADDRVIDERIVDQGLTNAISFAADGKRYALAGNDGTVRMVDLATGRFEPTLSLEGQPIRRAVFDPTGRFLFTLHDDNVVRGWDIAQRRVVRGFRGHGAGIESLRFIDDSALLLTASSDRTVRLWDSVDGSAIGTWTTHTDHVLDAVYVDGAHTVVSVDDRGDVYRTRCTACRPASTVLDAARERLGRAASTNAATEHR